MGIWRFEKIEIKRFAFVVSFFCSTVKYGAGGPFFCLFH